MNPKRRRSMTFRSILSLTLTAGLLAGCGGGGKEGGTPETPPVETGATIPAAVFVDAAPEGARHVSEVKVDAKEGDTIVVRGRVGGPAPFVPGRAVMTLADTENLIACSDREHDPCPKPWDYCCESPDDITANSLTVQVVDADGRPLKAGLEGAGGIDPLDFVVVTGTVGPRPDPNVLVVNATAIHVEN
jgi:hypothetical protein